MNGMYTMHHSSYSLWTYHTRSSWFCFHLFFMWINRVSIKGDSSYVRQIQSTIPHTLPPPLFIAVVTWFTYDTAMGYSSMRRAFSGAWGWALQTLKSENLMCFAAVQQCLAEELQSLHVLLAELKNLYKKKIFITLGQIQQTHGWPLHASSRWSIHWSSLSTSAPMDPVNINSVLRQNLHIHITQIYLQFAISCSTLQLCSTFNYWKKKLHNIFLYLQNVFFCHWLALKVHSFQQSIPLHCR